MPKPHEPTDQLRLVVRRLAGLGHTQDRIAYVLKITRRTLMAHYEDELSESMATKNEAVEASLFEMATGKEIGTGKSIPRNVTAAIWWDKTRAGRQEPAQDLNLNGRVVHATRADLSPYTDDELRDLRRIEEQRAQRDARARAITGAVDATFTVSDQGGARQT